MTFTVSLRRTMLMLAILTVIIVMLVYWNQTLPSKPQIFISAFEKSIINRSSFQSNLLPTEKSWTYKCEADRCVRYHFLKEKVFEKRVPFMTCSMTCGDINIWPHPTRSSIISSKSLLFSIESIDLKIDTPFHNVERLLQKVSNKFLEELRKIQRLKLLLNDKKEKTVWDYVPNKTEGDINLFQIFISIKKSDGIDLSLETDESYNISTSSVGNTMVANIHSNTFFGARHALSTLQQLIWYDDEDKMLRIISKSLIVDAPKFRYRGLMLDTSRHFFSVKSIKRTLDGMSHAKLNRFHWHITDSQSFPFVSKFYPELAAHGAYSEQEVYTHDDIRDIVAYAKIRGIQVIPEIDAPAHAGNGWEWGPKKGLGELSLCINQQPWNMYCGEPPCGQLNPKNNNTYIILQKLYEELLNLTGPTDYFHVGGDEVNLECWAQYFNETDLRGIWCDFMLETLNRFKLANNNVSPKFLSVWSSGLTGTKCLPSNQYAVQVWGGSSWPENYDLLENGYSLVISHVDAWYLDCGFGSWRATGDAACSPYRTWQTVYKHRPWYSMRLDSNRLQQILGGEVCLWTEQVDESGLDNRLWPRAAAIGERLWTDPDDDEVNPIPKEIFNRISIFRNRLIELGMKAEPIFPKFCAQNPTECV